MPTLPDTDQYAHMTLTLFWGQSFLCWNNLNKKVWSSGLSVSLFKNVQPGKRVVQGQVSLTGMYQQTRQAGVLVVGNFLLG